MAQQPAEVRDQARLLVDLGAGVQHRRVCDLPELVGAGDVLVVNDTRVLPARLRLVRATGGKAEALLLTERGDGWWEALVRPASRLRPGERLSPRAGPDGGAKSDDGARSDDGAVPDDESDTDGAGPQVEIGADLGEGRRLVRVHTAGRSVTDVLDEVGVMPLPPYINENIDDPERYQTVYSRRALSAAAPTAGLHFTDDLLQRIAATGAEVASVELVVGLDTFRPITATRLDQHQIHTEQYRVPEATRLAVKDARRVIAVGTTAVRALETWAATGEPSGHSSLFIRRPYRWACVDVMITNFHLPRSSLLCLVDAFVGPRWRRLYSLALEHHYRFLSFGDAMILARRDLTETGEGTECSPPVAACHDRQPRNPHPGDSHQGVEP